MGRPPAIVIVARHGARLDAADTQWHLTSPTPYDPPLTYGGWRQSQALGAKIASIIHSQEAAGGSQDSNGNRGGSGLNEDCEGEAAHNSRRSYQAKRRRYRIVIHSSPFLRCIQTSVAISAGMAQHQCIAKATPHSSHGKHTLHSGSPRTRAMDLGKSPHLSAILEPQAASVLGRSDSNTSMDSRSKTLLRVDAFLGEWLSPDYFDKITSPPESKLMVAGAKAALLRQGDSVEVAHASSRNVSSRGHFPGGWGSTTSVSSKAQVADEPTPLADMSSLSQSLPRLARASSHSMGLPTKRSNHNVNPKRERSPGQGSFPYVPPTPSYAISPSQPIPQGYVAHARDACVKVDYQWDSSRAPLEWGNGGEYGEEWSSMHKRFRRGLHQMISWYRSYDPIALVRTLSEGLPDTHASEYFDDEDADTVLVLVTHGAGCNALIGALTNQPVLIDVGTASLTMAVRKTIDYRRVASPTAPGPQISPSHRRLSNIDFGISEDYDVKLIASTDHLRVGSQYIPGSQLQRTSTLPTREKSPYRYERPHFVDSHHQRSPVVDEDEEFQSGSNSTTPTKKDQYRAISNGVTAPAPSSGVVGLWSKPVPAKDDQIEEMDTERPIHIQAPQLDGVSDTSLNIQHPWSNGSLVNGNNSETKRANSASEKNTHGHSIAPSGLWGAPPHALATERDVGAKRRWTLSQAS